MIQGAALLAVMALAGGQSLSADGSGFTPASEAAIVAGGKACIGATIDPDWQATKLAGWSDTVALPQGAHTDGRVVGRDNVILMFKTGVDGGCVVVAKADKGFAKAAFLTDLSKAAGATIDGTKPKVDLPNGEFIVAMVGGDKADTMVQVIVANPNNSHIKHSQGN